MKEIKYITTNKYKFAAALEAMRNADIKLMKEEIETPEIQSTSVEEIASFSAKWAADKLGMPVVLTDGGFFIRALNGFPGPFIKYVNQWLSAEDLLKLMNDKSDRVIEVKECLAYCEPGKDPITFCSSAFGTISKIRGAKGRTSINEIFIPEGYDKVESEIGEEEMIKFWSSKLTHWEKFSEFMRDY